MKNAGIIPQNAGATPQNTGITLRNAVLQVEIAVPYALYNLPRFDSAGIIRQVTLNGRVTFCASEHEGEDYANGGIGLCGEFGIDGALGYAEAGAGDWVPKIGVGRIYKADDAPYSHMGKYDFEKLDISYAAREDEAEFRAVQPDLNGFAYEYEKRVSISGNRLKIGYRLCNAGSKDIVTTEYCHNFVRFNDLNIGRDYALEVREAGWPSAPAGGRPGTYTFAEEPKETYYMRDSEPKGTRSWRLTHAAAAGLAMSEKLSADACRFALWGTNRVISPELFFGIDLKPGGSREWSREYVFEEKC